MMSWDLAFALSLSRCSQNRSEHGGMAQSPWDVRALVSGDVHGVVHEVLQCPCSLWR